METLDEFDVIKAYYSTNLRREEESNEKNAAVD